MQPTVVRGSFATEDGAPVEGRVQFVPDRIWVYYKSQCYATYAPTVELEDGAFQVELTPTDTGYQRWQYTAITPAGNFKIYIPSGEPRFLKELIAKSTA
jgi:hypothetical protein